MMRRPLLTDMSVWRFGTDPSVALSLTGAPNDMIVQICAAGQKPRLVLAKTAGG
jgi:hypothetical protein